LVWTGAESTDALPTRTVIQWFMQTIVFLNTRFSFPYLRIANHGFGGI